MLGCQDFCGYYDWTFAYLQKQWGPEEVHDYWVQAIAGESQSHYLQAGQADGLKGLYDTWVQTGKDEHCDWTFTLDEQRNVLRCDMRQCPSKGFLLEHDRNASEDYCDHCAGWIVPMLEDMNGQLVGHEHNHNGQCWYEMSIKGKPYQSLSVDCDIRNDPRWGQGYIESWENNQKQPLAPAISDTPDPCEVLIHWFSNTKKLTVLGRGPSAIDAWAKQLPNEAVIVTGPTYALHDVYDSQPRGVLIGDHPALEQLKKLACRFNQTPKNEQPLLMYAYLPTSPKIDFASLGLPRPVPILPLLIRQNLYHHQPDKPYPTTGVFALMIAAALEKEVYVAGIDLYRHASGQMYANGQATSPWPSRHSESCDRYCIQKVLDQAAGKIHLHLESLMGETLFLTTPM